MAEIVLEHVNKSYPDGATAVKDLNITTGCGAGNYCPSQVVTREQMAAFLARAFLGM